MSTLINDVKYALRQLRKSPGFTAVAVISLALGIGANTTVFNLINTFLFRPVIGQREGQLVQCYNRDTVRPDTYRAFSYPNYVDLRERNRAFLHLSAYELMEVGVMEGDISRRVVASMVSANYFSTFGVTMARGRAFLSEEEQPDSAIPVSILSHAAWIDGGADPDIIGKTMRIQNRTYTIVGVAPRGFAGAMSVMSPYFWLPLGMRDALQAEVTPGDSVHLNDRHQHCLLLVGQLKHGVNRIRAESELRILAGQLERAFPAENKDRTIDVHPLPRLTVGPWPEVGSAGRTFVVGRIVPMLLAVAGAVLFISCLNLANLLLSRGTVRRKEIALRLALGAKRRHIVRQLLTEALVLSFLGGAAGLFLAFWLTRLFALATSLALPYVVVFNSMPDLRVLAVTLGFCGLSVFLFGLGPAWRLSRPGLVTDLKEQISRPVSSGSGRSLLGMRSLLVVGQLAISLSLLTAAGLFIRGAVNATRVNPGFALKDGLVVEVDPVLAGYDEVRSRQVYRVLIQRLHSLPGVEDVSLAACVPFGWRKWRGVRRAGVAPATSPMAESVAADRPIGVDHNVVGADYFRTVGLSLVKGREFGPSEMEPGSASSVAVIDRELADRLWPGEEALGHSLQIEGQVPGEEPRVLEVVGIVPTLRNSLIEPKPVPHLYVPWGFEYQPKMHIHLRLAPRGRQNELALLGTVREEIRAVDAGWPVISVKTLADLPKGTFDLWLVKTGAQMFIVFGGLALVLASVGMYGVKSFTTAQRTREIGIRMAIGATARSVLLLILREGLILTAVGLGCGMLLAGAAGHLLSSLLYGVSPLDPWVFGLAPVFLTGTALLACYLPARRAAKIDPMEALRYE
jgi:predicted permease